MLADFNEIKEDLGIVNGSFVTLRDPIKIENKNIHIRDTMLLAPAGSKSLAQIGLLYGLQKIDISKVDLENMLEFLLTNPEKYVEYAIRDALISLVHAL